MEPSKGEEIEVSRAVLCPVCVGRGKVAPVWAVSTTGESWSVTCHGCGGKGWVEVHESCVVSNCLKNLTEWEIDEFVRSYIKNKGNIGPVFVDDTIKQEWQDIVYALDKLWWHFNPIEKRERK